MMTVNYVGDMDLFKVLSSTISEMLLLAYDDLLSSGNTGTELHSRL